VTTEYRYLFADVLTNSVLAELPLTGVSFGKTLNAAGSFSGSLLLSDLREDVYAIADNTTPGRTALYVDRSGTIVWGGIVWGRQYQSEGQRIDFQAREFESYFEKRRILTTYSASSVDQLQVAKALVDQVQAVASGNIGITVPSLTSGVLVSKTYNSWDQKPLVESLYELSRADNGFDWNIDVSYDSSFNIVKNLDLAYPRRGTVYAAGLTTVPVLEFPGNVVSYTYPEEGGSIANTMLGVGSGSGEGKYLSTATSATQITAGWPVLQQSVSLTDYSDQTLLANMTLAHLNAAVNPIVVMQVVTEAYNDPVLGSFRQGDDVRVRIRDPRFPDGIDIVRRIANFTVQPGESGPERITFNLVIVT
jgi:hypothetical protein